MGKKHKRAGRRSGLQAVTLCISTAMVLILLGLVVSFTLAGRNLSALVKENLLVTVMLDHDMTDTEARAMCKGILVRPYIKEVNYISKQDALKEATRAMGADPTEFTQGENPFSPSIELTLMGGYANNDSLKWISAELKKYPKVTEVNYQKDLMDVVNKNLSRIGLGMLVLAALLTFISFTLINNTVRLDIYARRFSIHTMKLVGASWGYICRPFVLRAVGIGLLAALIAIVALGGMGYAIYTNEPKVVNVVGWQDVVVVASAVILFGIVITGLCASISVRRYLKMKASTLYNI